MSRLIDIYADEKGHTRQARLARFVQRFSGDKVFFLLSRLLYRLRVIGAENIPSAGACIFAMNHVSLLSDSLCYLVARRARPNLHFFAWQNLRDENPMLGFMQQFGEGNLEDRYYRVYKARGISAGELLRARRSLLTGESVIITAEGFLTWDGRFQHPLEPGTAWMALRAGVPVVPMVSLGGYDVQPYWDIERMKLTGRITIRVGQPLVFTDQPVIEYDEGRLEATSEQIWQAMNTLIQQGH